MKVKLGTYRHFKGHLIEVIAEAKHTETEEEMVVYWHLEEDGSKHQLWVRPKTMFLEKVTRDGKTQPRFKYIKDQS